MADCIELIRIETQSPVLELCSGCKFIQIRNVPDSLQRESGNSLVTVASILLPKVGFVLLSVDDVLYMLILIESRCDGF